MHTYKSIWKRTLLTGGIALFMLSGSAVTAVGRPLDPVLHQPAWSPLAYKVTDLAKWKSEFSSIQTLSLQQTFSIHNTFPILMFDELPDRTLAVQSLREEAAAAQPTPDIATITATAVQEAPAPASSAVPAAAPAKAAAPTAKPSPQRAKKEVAAKAETKAAAKTDTTAAASSKQIVTSAGETITPKKTIAAVASAYTGSAEENGGYAGKDYFGNPLQVGTIAVDPKIIPLGTTVYVTGYTYNGLPAGGMMAKAVDIGGAIKGNRVDIYVPDSREEAKKFGYQNITLHVVD